jgi:hypothetical protein
MVTIPGEEPQKKQKNYNSIPEKGRDKNYQKLKIQTQITMGGGKHNLIALSPGNNCCRAFFCVSGG